MKNKKNQRGYFLIELLIGLLLINILFAMSLPNIGQMRISSDQRKAADTMRRIANSELYFTQLYGSGFRSPFALSQIAFPKTCEASGLSGGNESLIQGGTPTVIAGYTYLFTFGATAAPLAGGCTINGFTSFTLTATPINPANQRTFYIDQSGLVRYVDGGTAGPSSAVWNW
jgi:type II secretory pathway pseudopilin PulG